MASLGERFANRAEDVRRRRPLIDRLVRMQGHYGEVRAGQQAGAVTYFAFLSFFPVLALAFFVVGWVARVYADADDTLTKVLNSVMPGLVGSEEGQLHLDQVEQAANALGIIGAVVLLYSGLGWLSAMRDALVTVFETPREERPGFVVGKARDLVILVLIGVVLFLAVGVAGLVGGFSGDLLDWLGVDVGLDWLLTLLSVVLGFAANLVLFFLMFRLLGEPRVPRRSLWQGAAVGAAAFEVLKQLSGLLLRVTQGNPAFQAFGIALIVLVWINYFSRVVLYAAAFAYTSPEARVLRAAEPRGDPVQGPPSPPVRPAPEEEPPAWVAPYVAGAVSTLGLVAVVRRISRRRS
jgi:membrane protein